MISGVEYTTTTYCRNDIHILLTDGVSSTLLEIKQNTTVLPATYLQRSALRQGIKQRTLLRILPGKIFGISPACTQRYRCKSLKNTLNDLKFK